MQSSDLVIDIGVDPADQRRRRRRAWLRLGVPLAGVALMIAAILFIAVYSDHANRTGVLELSDDVLSGLDSRIALEVSGYLDPAARVARILRGMMKQDAVAQPAEAAALSATVLREIPQVENLSFADQDGNYILVRRGAGGGTEMKVIANAPDNRKVTWIYRDSSGTETGRREDPTDSFDPRGRPWYTGASASDALYWTGAYIFFTERKPGVTVSARYLGKDGRLVVYGVDISLEALSRFLAGLAIGSHGRAVIIDGDGRLVASPTGGVMVTDVGGAPAPAKIDQFGDPTLTRAYDELRTEGSGRHRIEFQGQPYIVMATPLPTAGRDWVILISVPESDFVGFVTSSNRQALVMSLAIVLLAAGLAILLMRQGLRADRNARLLHERQHAIRRQSEGFARIAAEASLFDPAHREPPTALTETLAETTGGRRAALWRIDAEGRAMTCEDSFERDSGGHTNGLELHRGEFPRFIAAMEQGEELVLADAAHDRRAAEFSRVLMVPFGSHRLLAMPVRRGGQTMGAVTVEDPPADPAHMSHGADFLRALANMLSLRMARTTLAAAGKAASSAPEEVPEAPVRSFTADLTAQGLCPEAIDATVFPNVAVMVVELTDPVAMALRPSAALGGSGGSMGDEIVRQSQRLAAEHGIPYLKVVGHELVWATGFAEGDRRAASKIAAAALAIRDACVTLFEESERELSFRIGLDWGRAIGCGLGSEPKIFNLWGDAVQTAHTMADSAPAGSVQVSEAAYQQLRREFLLRPRGRFHLPHIGEAQTFILASRA